MNEGIEEFDYIYDKIIDSDTQSQKEKLEVDLKKEIKKLQRNREQIKNWMSGNEVKEKRPLGEYRRKIEREMERFKEVEKVMKTKAFSNEALALGKPVLDPKQKEKAKCVKFLEENIDELQRQSETIEAELDKLWVSLKKHRQDTLKKRDAEDAEERLKKHRYHIKMLEGVMRRLMNDKLGVDDVNSIRDDIEYYVESNDDPSFVEDDDFYEELGLDENGDGEGDGDSTNVSTHPNTSAIPTPSARSSASPSPSPASSTSRTPSAASSSPAPFGSSSSQSPAPGNASTASTSTHRRSRVKSRDSSVRKSHQVPTVAQTLASQLSRTRHNSPQPHLSSLATGSGNNSPMLLSAGLKPATPVQTPKLKYATVAAAAAVTNNTPSSTSSNTVRPHPQHAHTPHPVNAVPTTSVHSQEQQQKQHYPVGLSPRASPAALVASLERDVAKDVANSIKKSVSFMDLSSYDNLPAGFDGYVKALEAAKERLVEFHELKGKKATYSLHNLYEMKLPPFEKIFPQLELSLLNCPDSYDSDTPKDYVPTNQFVTQPSFPQDPAVEVTGSTKLLKKLKLDTLAYCFYYGNYKYESTFTNLHNSVDSRDSRYLQYIVAQELHSRGWKYDRQTRTWYHRNDKNSAWEFFDYKDSWTVHDSKPNFKFNENHEERSFF